VDDEDVICQINAQVLAQSGYQVETAGDGAIAWNMLNQKGYELLITDHKMPNMSGVELLKKMRAAHMTLPAILVSGVMPTEELRQNPSLDLAATLPKPFDPNELLELVARVLRRGTNGPIQLPSSPANLESAQQ